MLERYLKELSEDLSLPTLYNRDTENLYHIHLNPSSEILAKELENGGAFFFSKIAPCPSGPPTKREDLFIHLMKANLLGQGTGGSTIGLSSDENYLTLSLALPYDMTYKGFRDSLEDFANYTDYWKTEINIKIPK